MERVDQHSRVGLLACPPSVSSQPKHKDLPALTGLRFFLALWVILHHLTGPGQDLEAVALQLPLTIVKVAVPSAVPAGI